MALINLFESDTHPNTPYLRRKNLTLIIYFIIYGININDSHTIRCICSSICSIFCYWCV